MEITTLKKKTYIYIGGGAAGYFAAINGAERLPEGHHIILEATMRPMTKIKISGGGRCNVTHHCFDIKELVKNYPRGHKELLGAFTRFQPQDTIAWFSQRGVDLKVEADGRMFPVSNKSESILQCFHKQVEDLGIEVRKGVRVQTIEKVDSCFHVHLHKGEKLEADALVLATGSFPQSFQLAESLGHKIVDPVPSLFTFNCSNPILENMMGTSFPKVNVELQCEGNKKVFKQKGPLLITHWGLSGPAVLKLSAFAAKELHSSDYKGSLKINWLGEMNKEQIFKDLENFKDHNLQKHLSNLSPFDISKRFWQRLVERTGLSSESMWRELSKKGLRRIAETLSSSEIQVHGKGVFKEEFVTCGGVDLKEVDFKTMQSKICSNLFFAGEILNIDGITGGFNFQNAWTTAWVASQNLPGNS